jgi:general secretion pathway protein M
MKELWNEFWQARNPRERAILIAGVILLALALLYGLAWLPLTKERQRLALGIPELRLKVTQMHNQSQEVVRLKTGLGEQGRAADVRQAIEDSLRSAGLREKVGSIDRLDNRRVRVTLNAVPFDPLLSWIESLQSQQHVRMETGQIEALPEAGLVKGTATFLGPGTAQ